MVRRIRMLAVMLLAVLAVLPAAAATPGERVDGFGFNVFSSARFEDTGQINGVEYVVGRGVRESGSRIHYVYRFLATDTLPEETFEVVYYDGTVYYRENTETQWWVIDEDIGIPPTPEELGEAVNGLGTITYIGEKTIAGTATDQYQIWVGSDVDNLVTDFFVNKSDMFVSMEGIRLTDSDADLGEIVLTDYVRFFDINGSFKVYTPANALPATVDGVGLIRPGLQTGSMIRAGYYIPAFREMALRHLP